MKAFVLGAGLGTRLLPLTEWLPKPLIPVYHRPLISYAFDHVLALGVSEFIVNTHHCPRAYQDAFPTGAYRGVPVIFRHEPVLLETAGGIANVADLLGNERFLVYNGDLLTDVPLAPLLAQHEAEGNEVTLLVRSAGPNPNVGLRQGRVEDLRGELGRPVERLAQFSGIYLVEPAFFRRLTPGKKESVVPIFQAMIRQGTPVGAALIDHGHWWDLGDEATYRAVHAALPATRFPAYAEPPRWTRVHPSAVLGRDVSLDDACCLGPDAVVGDGASLRGTILWPGAQVAPGEVVENCVRRGQYAQHRKHFF